ncbi:hypothetical protein [Sinorhizobium meliloti]|uniref:hypothetical protein n=1 Tax=Rhizobium meliloti TaxID=382 RepID=UPI001F1B775E|nr:hypothetical protein [Sinorhizobium meliloti]
MEKALRGITAGYNTPLFVVDAPGGGGKRDVHSFEHYDTQTRIAVYGAPSVRPNELFTYLDPLHSLSPDAQAAWLDPQRAERMMSDAVKAARAKIGGGLNHQAACGADYPLSCRGSSTTEWTSGQRSPQSRRPRRGEHDRQS